MDWIVTTKMHRGCHHKPFGRITIWYLSLLMTILVLCMTVHPAQSYFFPRSLFRRFSSSPSSPPPPISSRDRDLVQAEQQFLRIVNRPPMNVNPNLPLTHNRGNENNQNNQDNFHVPDSLCLACEKFPWTPVAEVDLPSGEHLQQQQSQTAIRTQNQQQNQQQNEQQSQQQNQQQNHKQQNQQQNQQQHHQQNQQQQNQQQQNQQQIHQQQKEQHRQQQNQQLQQQQQQTSNQDNVHYNQIPDEPTGTLVINAIGETNRRPMALPFDISQFHNENNLTPGNHPPIYSGHIFEPDRKPTILQPAPSFHAEAGHSVENNNSSSHTLTTSQNIQAPLYQNRPPILFVPQQYGMPVFDQHKQFMSHIPPPHYGIPNKPPPQQPFQYTRQKPLPPPPNPNNRPTVLQPVLFNNKPQFHNNGQPPSRPVEPLVPPPPQNIREPRPVGEYSNTHTVSAISPMTVGSIIAAQHNLQPAKLTYQEHSHFKPNIQHGNNRPPPPNFYGHHPLQNNNMPIISRPVATLQIDQLQFGSNVDSSKTIGNSRPPAAQALRTPIPASNQIREHPDTIGLQPPHYWPQSQNRPPQQHHPLSRPQKPEQARPLPPNPPQETMRPPQHSQNQFYNVNSEASVSQGPLPVATSSSNNNQMVEQNFESNRPVIRPEGQIPIVNQDLRHPHQITIPWLLQLEQDNQKAALSQEVGAYGQNVLNQQHNVLPHPSQQPAQQNLLPILIPNSVHVDSIQEYHLSSSSIQQQHSSPVNSPTGSLMLPPSQQSIHFSAPIVKNPVMNSQIQSADVKEPVVESERAPTIQPTGWEIIPAVQTDITHLFTRPTQHQENEQIHSSEINSKPQQEKQTQSTERVKLPVPLPVPIPMPQPHASNNPLFIVSEQQQNSKDVQEIDNDEDSSSQEQHTPLRQDSPGLPHPNAYEMTKIPVPESMSAQFIGGGNGPSFITYPNQPYSTQVNFRIPFREQRYPIHFQPIPHPPPSSPSQQKLYDPLPPSIVTALNHAQRTSFLTHQHLSQATDASAGGDDKKASTVYVNSVPVRDNLPTNIPFAFHQQLSGNDNVNYQQTGVDELSDFNRDVTVNGKHFSTFSLVPSSAPSSSSSNVQDANNHSNDDDNIPSSQGNPNPVYCSSHTQWVMQGSEQAAENSVSATAQTQPRLPQPENESSAETETRESPTTPTPAIKSKKLVPYIVYSRNPTHQSSRYWFDTSNISPPATQTSQGVTAGTTRGRQQAALNTPAESASAESPDKILFSPPVYGWSAKVVQKTHEQGTAAQHKLETTFQDFQKSSTAVPFEIISLGSSKETSQDEDNIQSLIDPEELLSGDMELSKLNSTETYQNVAESSSAESSEYVPAPGRVVSHNSEIRPPLANPSASSSYVSHTFRFPTSKGYGPGTVLEATSIPVSDNKDGPTQTWRAFYRVKSPKFVDDSSNAFSSSVDFSTSSSSSEIIGPTTTAECNTETTAVIDAGVTDTDAEVGSTVSTVAAPSTAAFVPSRVKNVSGEKVRNRDGARFPAGRPSISQLNPLPTPKSRSPNLSPVSFSAIVPTPDYRISSSQQELGVNPFSTLSEGSSSFISSSSRDVAKPLENLLALGDIYKSSETRQQFQQESGEDEVVLPSAAHPTTLSTPSVVTVTSTEKSSSFSVSVMNGTESDSSESNSNVRKKQNTHSSSDKGKIPRRISSVRISGNSPSIISSGVNEGAQSSDQHLVGIVSSTDSTNFGRISTTSPSPPLSTSTKIVKTVRVRQRMRPGVGGGFHSAGANGPIKSRFNGPGRIRVVQRPVNQDYIKSFPEFASPESDSLGKEEEEEVKNALIELKRSDASRA